MAKTMFQVLVFKDIGVCLNPLILKKARQKLLHKTAWVCGFILDLGKGGL